MDIEIVNWIRNVVVFGSALTILSIWGTFLYFGFRHKNYISVMRSMTVVVLFIVWLLIIVIQERLAINTSNVDVNSIPFYIGYFVFPFTLIALFRMVFLYAKDYFHYILTFPRYRLLTGSAAFLYGVFYLFASGMLTFADPSTSVVLEQGYVKASQAYGPLSIWPSIEFWWPQLHLFGIISAAGVFMLMTFVGLVGMGFSFIMYQWQLKKKWDLKVMGSTVGSSIAVTATCFVSCTLPAVYPLLIALFGSATAEPLSRLLANESGVLVNLVQMATLSSMAASVIFIVYRLKQLENGTGT